ncbi:MAG: hypothetical protein V4498_00605 [candidate division FCPU426 bacterium]
MAKAKSTALINWDEKMAAEATVALAMVKSAAVGEEFSIKDGILSFAGNPIEDNTMAVVILDAIMANANYPDKFDPKNPSGPNCFAYGYSPEEMAPHKVCVDAGTDQAPACVGCPHNEFGTNDRGTGKQCGNKYRLAIIPAGTFGKDGSFEAIEDLAHFKGAGVAYLNVPPTSLKAYAGFTKQLVGTMKRSPWGIFTRITLDDKNLVFEALDKIPNELMQAVQDRRKEAINLIQREFPKYTGPAKARGKAAPAQRAAGKSFTPAKGKAPAAKTPAPKGKPAAKGKAPAGKSAPVGFGGKAKKVDKF